MTGFKVVTVVGLVACLVLFPRLVRADSQSYRPTSVRDNGDHIELTIEGFNEYVDAYVVQFYFSAPEFQAVNANEGVIFVRKRDASYSLELYRVQYGLRFDPERGVTRNEEMLIDAIQDGVLVRQFAPEDAKVTMHYRQLVPMPSSTLLPFLTLAGAGAAILYFKPISRIVEANSGPEQDGEDPDYLWDHMLGLGALAGSAGIIWAKLDELTPDPDKFHEWMEISTVDGSRTIHVDVPTRRIGGRFSTFGDGVYSNLHSLFLDLRARGFKCYGKPSVDAGRGADVNLSHIGVGPIRNRGLGFVARFRF